MTVAWGSNKQSSHYDWQTALESRAASCSCDRRSSCHPGHARTLCFLSGHWLGAESILAGRGEPFEYAIHNYSIGELRLLLWFATSVLTAGIVGLGWAFVSIGMSIARDARAAGFGLRISANGNGAYDRFVKWYGGVLVVAGVLLMPLGASLLVILATCRYMRDV